MTIEREKYEFDVVFVGGGPASLAGAIRLMQIAQENDVALEVALIEKGAEIGAHAVSGAVLNPRALAELIPDYKEKGCPLETDVRADEFYFLTRKNAHRLPMAPRYMHNKGFHIISVSKFSRWLGGIAEEMGIMLFPGFAGKEVLYGEDGQTIVGIRTGDKGIGPDGQPKGTFEPGYDLMGKVTVLGEGARGSLIKEIDAKLNITSGKMPQVYETGIKEVIQLPEDNFFKSSKGNDIHTLGYPLGLINIPGGGFIYEMADNKISIGFLVALSYADPMIDPYETFIQFKQHPFVADLIKNGKVLEQGARTVATGGYFTIPELAVDGAVFIGGAAGMQNSPALKGIHVSMKSGMLAAEAIAVAIDQGDFSKKSLSYYADAFENSWAKNEIYEGRNFAQALTRKGFMKFVHLGAQYFTKGRGIVDRMSIEADHQTLVPLSGDGEPADGGVDRKVYDGELYVDKLTGVYLSKTMHREDQPSHIIVHDLQTCINECYPQFRSPCTRFCPGNVYEIEIDAATKQPKLKLNPSNCFHCKTCDIKDPFENITWTCPEGGEGPGYTTV